MGWGTEGAGGQAGTECPGAARRRLAAAASAVPTHIPKPGAPVVELVSRVMTFQLSARTPMVAQQRMAPLNRSILRGGRAGWRVGGVRLRTADGDQLRLG